jgi:curli biogenesis system outer membrane secretion channel CsgG
MTSYKTRLLRVCWLTLVLCGLSGFFVIFVAAAPAQTVPANLPPGVEYVVQLIKAGFGEDAILAKIKKAGVPYNLTNDQLIYLKNQGVSEKVIEALLSAGPPGNPSTEGLKKFIAVSRFENKTSYVNGGQTLLDDAMPDQLIDALTKSGQFIVLERQTLGYVPQEQRLAASGQAAASQSAQRGKLMTAQILIKGTITEFENRGAVSSGGVNVGPHSFNNKHDEAVVGLNLRLIDTTTGQVLDTQTIEGKAKSESHGGDVNLGLINPGQKGFEKTPLGRATQNAIDQAVQRIAARLKEVPFEARVIKAGPNEILVSTGSRNGITPGDEFTLYTVRESLVDPGTGDQFGSEVRRAGRIVITDVEEKYARARPEGSFGSDGSLPAQAGDVIRPPSPADPESVRVGTFNVAATSAAAAPVTTAQASVPNPSSGAVPPELPLLDQNPSGATYGSLPVTPAPAAEPPTLSAPPASQATAQPPPQATRQAKGTAQRAPNEKQPPVGNPAPLCLVREFSEREGWLAVADQLRTNPSSWGRRLQDLLTRSLLKRHLEAKAVSGELSTEQIHQLVVSGLQYLVDGEIERLDLQPSGDGQSGGKMIVRYRLQRSFKKNPLVVVQKERLTVTGSVSPRVTEQDLFALLEAAAEQIADRVATEIPKDILVATRS